MTNTKKSYAQISKYGLSFKKKRKKAKLSSSKNVLRTFLTFDANGEFFNNIACSRAQQIFVEFIIQ